MAALRHGENGPRHVEPRRVGLARTRTACTGRTTPDAPHRPYRIGSQRSHGTGRDSPAPERRALAAPHRPRSIGRTAPAASDRSARAPSGGLARGRTAELGRPRPRRTGGPWPRWPVPETAGRGGTASHLAPGAQHREGFAGGKTAGRGCAGSCQKQRVASDRPREPGFAALGRWRTGAPSAAPLLAAPRHTRPSRHRRPVTNGRQRNWENARPEA
jgi:hypothetical protein